MFWFIQEIVTVENEQKALCTDDYSDISPLTGGNVAFSTLESRPGAYNFDRSPVLQVKVYFFQQFYRNGDVVDEQLYGLLGFSSRFIN